MSLHAHVYKGTRIFLILFLVILSLTAGMCLFNLTGLVDIQGVRWDIMPALCSVVIMLVVILGISTDKPGIAHPMITVLLKLSIVALIGALIIANVGLQPMGNSLWYALLSLGISVVASGVALGAYFFLSKLDNMSRGLHRSLLLVGDKVKCKKWWDSLTEQEHRYCRACFFDPSVGTLETSLKDLQKLIQRKFPEKVFILSVGSERMSAIMERCALQGIELWVRDGVGELPASQLVCQKSLGQLSFTVLGFARSNSTRKLFLDYTGACLVMMMTSPLWLIAAIGIYLSDGRPIFYRQRRSGKYGRHFSIWKFRSMTKGADKCLDQVKKDVGNDMDGPIFKLKEDPRVFKFGKFIRKYSIDELPQLLNVLVGEMSMIGPRPLPVYETEAFEKIEHRRRLSVLPGITCYWQIEGRSTISDFDELVKLDFKYIDNWSLMSDAKIVLKTVPAILASRGAC
ncbi:MAG: exopolysaccharide biosynthesis polyprenyl glycosylphosphotransferase [Akkermansia sp.]